jgi:hypothetical protein
MPRKLRDESPPSNLARRIKLDRPARRFLQKTKPQFGRLGDFCYSGLLSLQHFSASAALQFLIREGWHS